ncbi:EF-hand domain-containing protein D2-like [Acanthaster planci]|uniref:EF-hand domain-containing protein D2-like n=1 Tax=Acanthaster planci TaxID=133434 RepID=A0A8B7YAB9_ACAPL|nr:EF-hand domain-containing protein D2-like [Acanthaster planci]
MWCPGKFLLFLASVVCVSRCATESAARDSELAQKLNLDSQQRINEGQPAKVSQSVYAEFKEFSIQDIKEYRKMFQKYDIDRSNFIDHMELKLMMEKVGMPQTHLDLKAMIKEVDEDNDGQISFREFMLIFSKALKGALSTEGLLFIAGFVTIDMPNSFFEAKEKGPASNGFEKEIIQEQLLQKAKAAEEAKNRREKFKAQAPKFS